MSWRTATLWERLCFLAENGERIPVRVEIDGEWKNVFLLELPDDLLREELYRLAKRDGPPVMLRLPR